MELTEVNIASLVHEVIETLNFQAKSKGLEIILLNKLKDKNHTTIKSDISRLRQVLLNLLGNAIKFTVTGNITITVREGCYKIGDKKIKTLSCFQSAEEIIQKYVFEIEDTGVGISQEQQETLFQNLDENSPLLIAYNGIKEI